ncbi:MAG TPA: hypothetical protein DDZ42_10630 [Candidatus Rokubacteria bacterium]|nr:hypothetical protein [Candidatus Rokubacteria bacterium]
MVSKTVVGLLIAAALAVGMLVSGTRSPDAAPERAPGKSLSASRLFLLLPDGRVELTDAWARRVFRWDGRRWLEVEVTRRPAPDPR